MTAEDRGLVLVTARMLEAAMKVDLLTTGLTLIATASLLVASPHRIEAIVAIALGLAAKFYAVRIAFDARLLDDIATGSLFSSDLDTAFPTKAGRSWDARCRGARRLVVVFVVLVVAQCVSLGAALLV